MFLPGKMLRCRILGALEETHALNLSHGFVEPDAPMAVEAYQQALAATRDQWQRAED